MSKGRVTFLHYSQLAAGIRRLFDVSFCVLLIESSVKMVRAWRWRSNSWLAFQSTISLFSFIKMRYNSQSITLMKGAIIAAQGK